MDPKLTRKAIPTQRSNWVGVAGTSKWKSCPTKGFTKARMCDSSSRPKVILSKKHVNLHCQAKPQMTICLLEEFEEDGAQINDREKAFDQEVEGAHKLGLRDNPGGESEGEGGEGSVRLHDVSRRRWR